MTNARFFHWAIFHPTGTRVVYLSEVKEELFYAGPVLHDYATSMPWRVEGTIKEFLGYNATLFVGIERRKFSSKSILPKYICLCIF